MILLIAAFAVILYFVEKYSLKHMLDKVTFETAVDKGVVEPDEAFSWSITARNGKRMMVPYLRLRENIPEGLLFADGNGPVGSTRFSWLTSTLYLGWRQRVCLSRDVMLSKRGRYFFHGASVEAGDFPGIRSVIETYPELTDVVVKPRRSDSPELAPLLGGYLRERNARLEQCFSIVRSVCEENEYIPILI